MDHQEGLMAYPLMGIPMGLQQVVAGGRGGGRRKRVEAVDGSPVHAAAAALSQSGLQVVAARSVWGRVGAVAVSRPSRWALGGGRRPVAGARLKGGRAGWGRKGRWGGADGTSAAPAAAAMAATASGHAANGSPRGGGGIVRGGGRGRGRCLDAVVAVSMLRPASPPSGRRPPL
eukprot:3374-Chlamydomonas_euryale.AAC.5